MVRRSAHTQRRHWRWRHVADDALAEILGGLFAGTSSSTGPGGSLGGLIPGGLGGLLGGAGAGSVLSGGLDNLIKDLQNNGQGEVAKSWVANGPNQAIAPESLEAAVGVDTLDALAKQPA